MMGWGTCIIGRPTQDKGNGEEGKSNPRPMKLHRTNPSPLINLSRVLAHQEIHKKSWIPKKSCCCFSVVPNQRACGCAVAKMERSVTVSRWGRAFNRTVPANYEKCSLSLAKPSNQLTHILELSNITLGNLI